MGTVTDYQTLVTSTSTFSAKPMCAFVADTIYNVDVKSALSQFSDTASPEVHAHCAYNAAA